MGAVRQLFADGLQSGLCQDRHRHAGRQGPGGALEREKAEISTGAYTGDNAASRTIHLGFRPRAVLVEMALGNRYGSNGGESISGGLAVDGWPVFYQDINGPCTPGHPDPGRRLRRYQDSRNRSYMNYSGTKYHYFAVK